MDGKHDTTPAPGRYGARNQAAAMARLFAVLSFIPGLALVTGPIAFVFGVMGLRHNRRRPTLHGHRNSWVGIGVGGVLFAIYAAFVVKVSVLSWREHQQALRAAAAARQSPAQPARTEEPPGPVPQGGH